jgi:PAS domain S-box-containing protein
MATSDDLVEENRRLRRTMRDLVAFSTLPAVWIGLPVPGIARGLADVLLNTLSLDLVYMQLTSGSGDTEVVRSRQRDVDVGAVRSLLTEALASDGTTRPAAIPDFLEGGALHLAVTRFGVGAENGVLVTGSRNAEFPTERDRLLLGVGANQTAIVLHRRRAEDEQRLAVDKLREAEEQFRAMADNIPQLSWMATPDGSLFWFNRRWYEYTGRTFEEMRGDGWKSVVRPEDLDRATQSFARSVASGEPWEDTFALRRHDGELRWHLSRAMPIKNESGVVLRWFGSNTDVTEQRKMAADLAEADRRKNEFLATLAHELRNPLAPIRTGLQVLEQSGGHGVDAVQARTMMDRQLGQMVRLVDDLMDVSRITSGKIELRKEPVQLAAAVNSAIETTLPLIEQMGHELSVTLPEQPIAVNADLTRLAQVFMNLLNNAAKYSERGGRIELIAKRQAGDVVVSVKDNGIGIDADHLPTIFEMFSQVDRSLEKAQGGLGIGLTLVKRLVEMHGGTVDAYSDGLDRGSEFIVRLPILGDAVAAENGPPKRKDSLRSSLRILIVDDNQDGADLLAMMLESMGNETRVAYDGEEAVSATREFRPDVVLLDLGLPKLNGYDACRLIRAQDGGKDLLLIAQTGWGQSEDRQRTREAGFDHHLVKPLDPHVLQKLLADLRPRSSVGADD